jgi:transcriptional regulator with XRE-family HTH domain
VHETELPEAPSRAIAQAVREALARRRISRQALADLARISISTLEKALAGRRPFTLATTIRLEEALGQRLREGVEPVLSSPVSHHAPTELGAYSRESAAWLEGRYLTLRPSFGAADAVFAYRTEIAWDAPSTRLVFSEAERLDAPFSQTGSVSVPNQSGMIYLVTNWQGQCRLAVLCRPTIHGEMFGLLTTLHAGRGTQLTPAAAPLALIPDTWAGADVSYGRVTSGMPAYDGYRRQLARVVEEGYAVLLG